MNDFPQLSFLLFTLRLLITEDQIINIRCIRLAMRIVPNLEHTYHLLLSLLFCSPLFCSIRRQKSMRFPNILRMTYKQITQHAACKIPIRQTTLLLYSEKGFVMIFAFVPALPAQTNDAEQRSTRFPQQTSKS